MASAEEIAQLRRLINDQAEPYSYSDEVLDEYLDANAADIRATGAIIWREKASKYVEMVDVREGAAQRSLGDMLEHALAMAEALDGGTGTPDGGGTTTRPIERV